MGASLPGRGMSRHGVNMGGRGKGVGSKEGVSGGRDALFDDQKKIKEVRMKTGMRMSRE